MAEVARQRFIVFVLAGAAGRQALSPLEPSLYAVLLYPEHSSNYVLRKITDNNLQAKHTCVMTSKSISAGRGEPQMANRNIRGGQGGKCKPQQLQYLLAAQRYPIGAASKPWLPGETSAEQDGQLSFTYLDLYSLCDKTFFTREGKSS